MNPSTPKLLLVIIEQRAVHCGLGISLWSFFRKSRSARNPGVLRSTPCPRQSWNHTEICHALPALSSMFWLDLLCPVSSLTLWLSKPSSLPEVPWSPQRCAAQSQNRQWELEKKRVEWQRLPGVSVGSTSPHTHLHFRCTPRLPAAHPALAAGTPQVSSGEKWSISCHGSKQGGHSQPSNVSASAPRILRKEKNTFHLPAIRLQPLPPVSPKEAQDVKTQDMAPDC